MSNFFCQVCGGQEATTAGGCARCGLPATARVWPSVTLPTVLTPVRDENGWGRLRLEEVPEYTANRERLTKALASLAKAYAYLPGHIDGEFSNALHDVKRCVEWAIGISESVSLLGVRRNASGESNGD